MDGFSESLHVPPGQYSGNRRIAGMSGGGGSTGPLKIGNYILGETLGIGSFGKVKLASHQHTRHQVAVKILNRKKIKSLDMVGKIKREIQNLKLFSHPHIIKLYEVISTPTDIFMVMEYVCGGELFEYIVKHGKLSEDAARTFFQQIICAVEYCHRHKVVHRDLKPENLLLDENGNVKIADFGLSNIMMDGDFLKTSCGSPNYAAPEVISGKLYAGPEVDIWSCGVILYALLCGKLPFDDEYIPNLFKKIKGGIFTLPPHLSDSTKGILRSMLNVDPLKRATITQIREHPWFQNNLPTYLEPHVDHNDASKIDESVVSIVCENMSATKSEVTEAANSDRDNDPLKIAYHLILDNKEMRLRAVEMKELTERLQDPEVERKVIEDVTPMEDLPTLSKSLLGSPTSGKKRRSRWYLGIRSRSQPHAIMAEVFRALMSLGFEWKVISPFHIHCRSKKMEQENKLNGAMRMGLQLYKVDDRHFLLDFKVVDPREFNTLSFFEYCALLIRELAVTSSR